MIRRSRRLGLAASLLFAPGLVAAPTVATPIVAAAGGENVPPVVSVQVSDANPVEKSITVAASIADPESAAESYLCTIDFGDGSPQEEVAVAKDLTCGSSAHTYAASGVYTVVVTVRENPDAPGGLEGRNTAEVTYTNAAPSIGDIEMAREPQVGMVTWPFAPILDPGSTWESYACTVDYGDGSGPVEAQVTGPGDDGVVYCSGWRHLYADPGTYTVTLTATDPAGASGSRSTDIVVAGPGPGDPPAVTVTVSDPNPVETETWLTATWTDTVPDQYYTCIFDYGDGTPLGEWFVGQATTCELHHLFAQTGTYQIRMTITATDSAWHNARTGAGTASVTARNVPPSIHDVALVGSLAAGQAVHAQGVIDDPGAGWESYACYVDYGDGSGRLFAETLMDGWPATPRRCKGPDHVYAKPGTYRVTVSALDAFAGWGESSADVTIGSDNVPPTVSVAMSDYNPVETPVTATATIDDPESATETYVCAFDYGDGTPVWRVGAKGLECVGPPHTYRTTGAYTITVTVTENPNTAGGLTGIGTSGVYFTNRAPWVGGVGLVGDFRVGQPVHLVGAIVDPGSAWETFRCVMDYGDGTAIAGTLVREGWDDGLPRCVGPDHVYAAAATYLVKVTATDDGGGSGSASFYETIAGANAAPTIQGVRAPASARVGTSVTIAAPYADDGQGTDAYTATFDWGDGSRTTIGLAGSTGTATGTHTYRSAGMYAVHVTVSDGALASAVAATSPIAVWDPTAGGVTGKGSLVAPAGSCRLYEECAAAATASFSLSASYRKGATTPTISFTYDAPLVAFKATSADWLVRSGNVVTIHGTGTWNAGGPFTFDLTVVDGSPDTLQLRILGGYGSEVDYELVAPAPLTKGSLQLK